jgi:putative peptidoglycan lipid II flippase
MNVDNFSKSNRQIARAAGTVMLAFIFSQLAGLIRRILVAQVFGASIELDAFIAANRVSETLFNLIAGGALGSAFIPTYTAFLSKGKKDSAWKLASSIANLVFIILILLGIIAFFFAPQIVRYALAPGLANNPLLLQLTVNLLRIQLVSAILFGMSGLVMGILNSHQVFLIPALTPAMYQLGMIFGVLILSPKFGIYGLAWGVVLGAFLHLVLQIPSLIKQRGTYSFDLGIGNPAVGEVIRLMIPRLAGVAVVQLNFWVNSALATQMEPGSLAGVDYGFSLMLMAQAVIAQSIATAMMPTLASQYALGKLDEVRDSLSATIRGVLFLAIPASVGLILLRQPITAFLYQRGNFSAHSTELVSWALLWYAAGLIGHSLLEILARAFYALHDTKTPVMVGVAAMGLNVVFSFSFSAIFARLGWMPHGGLALANSFATALEAITLLILMRKRLKGIFTGSIIKGFGQSLGASLIMGIAIFASLKLLPGYPFWLKTISGMVIGGSVYAVSILIMRVPEFQALIKYVKSRIAS